MQINIDYFGNKILKSTYMIDLQLEKKIKYFAKSKGLNVKELCKRIEITEQGLVYALKNNTLKVETLNKIADVLTLPIMEFFLDDVDDVANVRIEKKANDFIKNHNDLIENNNAKIFTNVSKAFIKNLITSNVDLPKIIENNKNIIISNVEFKKFWIDTLKETKEEMIFSYESFLNKTYEDIKIDDLSDDEQMTYLFWKQCKKILEDIEKSLKLLTKHVLKPGKNEF